MENYNKRKGKKSDSVLWKKKPPHQQKCQKGKVTTQKRHKKFDYTAVADRFRTVSLSNYSHPTDNNYLTGLNSVNGIIDWGYLSQNIFDLIGVKSCNFRQNNNKNARKPGIVSTKCMMVWDRERSFLASWTWKWLRFSSSLCLLIDNNNIKPNF